MERIVPGSFLDLLKKVLASNEFGYSDNEAESLMGNFPDIVMEGISGGDDAVRDTARALKKREQESYIDRGCSEQGAAHR